MLTRVWVWIVTRDEGLRILSDEQWTATHDRLRKVGEHMRAIGAAEGNRRRRDVDSPFLLSSFARCANCGCSIGVLSGGRARRRVYGCSRRHKTGRCSNDVRVPIERVDEAVLHAIVDQVLSETVVESVVERVLARLDTSAGKRSLGEL